MTEYPYEAELAKKALEYIRSGLTPTQFCGYGNDVPQDPAAIEVWETTIEEFAKDYAIAKRIGAEAMVSQCLMIADSPQHRADAKKIMIDTRMKLAGIWHPLKYGPKAEKDPPTTMQALVHVPYGDLTPEKKAAVDKFFGTDDV